MIPKYKGVIEEVRKPEGQDRIYIVKINGVELSAWVEIVQKNNLNSGMEVEYGINEVKKGDKTYKNLVYPYVEEIQKPVKQWPKGQTTLAQLPKGTVKKVMRESLAEAVEMIKEVSKEQYVDMASAVALAGKIAEMKMSREALV